MSKKKKYFLGDELSIIESNSDKSVNLNETLASKSNEQKCKRYSRKPLFGMVLRRPFINKQSSNVCCIEELEDRCLIKIPKKKVSNDDKTVSRIERSKTSHNIIDTIRKKPALSKCKVITNFGKKCPPPPGIKSEKTSLSSKTEAIKKEKKTKDFSDRVNFEIDRLATLLKDSLTGDKPTIKKLKTESAAKRPSQSDSKALVKRPALTIAKSYSKKIDSKKIPREKEIRTKPHPIKPSIQENIQSQVDIEIEKLVLLLNETKELIGNKLSKKRSSSKVVSSETSKPRSKKLDTKILTKNSAKQEVVNVSESLPNKINKEIEKIANLLKDKPSSIVEKFRSSEKKSTRTKKEKSDVETSLVPRRKNLLVVKIDLTEEKAKVQKVKEHKKDTVSEIRVAVPDPSNLKKEIKLFKLEKETFVTKMKNTVRDRLDKDKKHSKSSKNESSKDKSIISSKESKSNKYESAKEKSTSKKNVKSEPTPVIYRKKIDPPPESKIIKEPEAIKHVISPRLENLRRSLRKENDKKSTESTKTDLPLKDKLRNEELSRTLSKRFSKSIDKENKSISSDGPSVISINMDKTRLKISDTVRSSNQSNGTELSSSKIIISKEPKKINESFKKVTSARRKIIAILTKQLAAPLIEIEEKKKEEPVLKREEKTIILKTPSLLEKDINSSQIESTINSPDEFIVKQKIKHLGIVETNPDDYMKQFGHSVIAPKDLPQYVLDIKPPEGISLAANVPLKTIELEGDIYALKLVDRDVLEREGLSAYKNI